MAGESCQEDQTTSVEKLSCYEMQAPQAKRDPAKSELCEPCFALLQCDDACHIIRILSFFVTVM